MPTKPLHTVTLIGAGNVATHLGKALLKAGCEIKQVYSPTGQTAKILAKKLKAQAIDIVKAIDYKGLDLVIVAIKDDAVAHLAPQLQAKQTLVVHTSGTLEVEVLAPAGANIGVLYPFQTFSKQAKVNFSQVPLFYQANSPAQQKRLGALAALLSNNSHPITNAQRSQLHIAGVFAANFTNYMYALAKEITDANGIPFETLIPLIQQTAEKVKYLAPHDAQTGPARRGDKQVIAQHTKLLETNKKVKEIYKLLSANILREYWTLFF